MVTKPPSAGDASVTNQVTVPAGLAPLFTPMALGALSLANRFVMAPMTRKRSPEGVPGEDVVSYYARRARNGVGLILTEGTVVEHPAAAGDLGVPRFYGRDALAGWQKVVEAVHDVGGRIMPQLWHVGALRPPTGAPNPEVAAVGPSGLVRRNEARGDTLSDSAIAAIIDAFAAAAADAKTLGFDGVELHGAHGYLIDQFFWSATNQRTDRYGGDIRQRTRFAAEIVSACRRRVGGAFPILFRFSQWKLQDYGAKLATSPGELEQLLRPLVDAGVDVFDCSARQFWQPEFGGVNANLATWTRQITGRPVITVGSVWQRTDIAPSNSPSNDQRLLRAAAMIADGDADLVGVGRALLADPEWVLKIKDGRADQVRSFSQQLLDTLA